MFVSFEFRLCRSQAYESIVALVAKNVNSFLMFFYILQRYCENNRGEVVICAYVFSVKIILTKTV